MPINALCTYIQKAPKCAGTPSPFAAYLRGARKHPMRRMNDEPIRLPPGYSLDASDPDVVALRRPDGTTVAVFSALGATPESIQQAAYEDHGRR
jgi:hypothetical protein